MKDVHRMWFEVWTDKSRNGVFNHMVTIHADIVDRSVDYKDHDGLYGIWFVMSREEFMEFARCGINDYADGYHKLQAFGDDLVFYDMEGVPSRVKCGKYETRYYRMNFPGFVRKVLLRKFNQIWAAQKAADDDKRERVTIEVSKERRERWERLYGCGTGQLRADMSDATADFFTECTLSDREDGTFQQRVEHLNRMAVNTTRAFFQTGVVRLWKDRDGFNFAIVNPKGQETMYGGLVNHGNDEKDADWSLHT